MCKRAGVKRCVNSIKSLHFTQIIIDSNQTNWTASQNHHLWHPEIWRNSIFEQHDMFIVKISLCTWRRRPVETHTRRENVRTLILCFSCRARYHAFCITFNRCDIDRCPRPRLARKRSHCALYGLSIHFVYGHLAFSMYCSHVNMSKRFSRKSKGGCFARNSKSKLRISRPPRPPSRVIIFDTNALGKVLLFIHAPV